MKSFVSIFGGAVFALLLLFAPIMQSQFEYLVRKNNENMSTETLCSSVGGPEIVLCIPKLQMHVPITGDADWKNMNSELRNGVTHLLGTAQPGNEGNAVFFGHSSGYIWEKGPSKTVFVHLNKLQEGDDIYFTQGEAKWRYRVRWVRTVMPNDTSVLNQDFNEKASTFITCWPPGTTLERLVVRAQLQ